MFRIPPATIDRTCPTCPWRKDQMREDPPLIVYARKLQWVDARRGEIVWCQETPRECVGAVVMAMREIRKLAKDRGAITADRNAMARYLVENPRGLTMSGMVVWGVMRAARMLAPGFRGDLPSKEVTHRHLPLMEIDDPEIG